MAEPFDMSLVQRGARNRRTPFYEATQQYGPKGFTVYNHMYFPIRFDDFEAENEHLLTKVTLWDVAVERNIEVSGPDGFRFAQLVTPRDLSKCEVGQGKYVLITAPDGGILNDPVMIRIAEDTFWFALASSDVLFYFKGLAAYAGLNVTLREVDASPVQVQGPLSKDVIRDLFGDEVVNQRYYFFTRTELDGIPVIVTRTGWTSEVGYEVYLLDHTRGYELWEKIMAAGARYDIKPTGPSDIRRIEGGIFNWGADMTYDNNPFEMGLERLVDFDMPGECLSLPALARIRDGGVSKRIVGVELDGDAFPALNYVKWLVEHEGATVGKVTSAIHSPRMAKNIGYAWLPVELANVGQAVLVHSEWGDRTATVVPIPFVDPGKQIPKS